VRPRRALMLEVGAAMCLLASVGRVLADAVASALAS